MGRMSDLWKPSPTPAPRAPALEVVPAAEPALHDWFSDEASVPFIEVGGSQPSATVVTEKEPAAPASPPSPILKLMAEPLSPGVFTVRYRPVLAGALPGRGFGPELIALHEPDHPVSEQYRLLLGEITLQMPGGPPRVLLFTGATAESGTTTVVLNLAATLARTESFRVTLVDANYPRPALAERLGLAAGPGLREVLSGRTPLPWALQNTRLANLRVLSVGRTGEAAADTTVAPMVERLRGEADWVLIDAPTWPRPTDAAALADCCDGVFLVMRQADADNPAVAELQQGLLDATGRLKGCVITQR